MRFVVITALAAIILAPSAGAQKLDLRLDALAAKASGKSEVDLDPAILKLALQFGLSKKDKDANSPVGDWLNGLQELRVRSYQFAREGAYSDQDIEPLRKQVAEGSGWSRALTMKQKGESAEIFVYAQGGKITGCLILAAEDAELSVIYVRGTLTLAQVKELVDSHIADNLKELI